MTPTGEVRRVLVTGSRDWKDKTVIRIGLSRAMVALFPDAITLVSGNCRGADLLCEEWAEAHGWTVERHPADWSTYGRSAGFRRNTEMVNLGADICVAFIKNGSRGSTGTARLAKRAGIEVWTYTE